MTLTRHGHHIPGTVDADEDPNASRARCGGVQLCHDCYREWRVVDRHIPGNEKKVTVTSVATGNMKMGANANGQGLITKEILTDLLRNIPDEAEIRITSQDDQRDGKFWTFSAEWGQDIDHTQNGTKITNVHAKPPFGSIGSSVRSSQEFHERMRPSAQAGGDQYFGAYGVGTPFGSD